MAVAKKAFPPRQSPRGQHHKNEAIRKLNKLMKEHPLKKRAPSTDRYK